MTSCSCNSLNHLLSCSAQSLKSARSRIRFICCFMSRSTARVILRRVDLQVKETSAYCTVNHRASASNYQLSNMKRPARDSNRWPQRLEARTLTTTPPSPPPQAGSNLLLIAKNLLVNILVAVKVWSTI